MSADHGYARYSSPSKPCRCDICRQAKADYIRNRRAAARAKAQKYTASSTGGRPNLHTAFAPGATRHLAPIPNHGSRYGYEEAGCRCRDCTTARTSSDRSYGNGGAA